MRSDDSPAELEDDSSEAMEVDQPGPSGSRNGQGLSQRVASAERAFLNFRDAQSFLQRVDQEILRKMCGDRGLSDSGDTDELYAKLVVWVIFSIFFPLVDIALTRRFSAIPTTLVILATRPSNRIPHQGECLGKISCRLSGAT